MTLVLRSAFVHETSSQLLLLPFTTQGALADFILRRGSSFRYSVLYGHTNWLLYRQQRDEACNSRHGMGHMNSSKKTGQRTMLWWCEIALGHLTNTTQTHMSWYRETMEIDEHDDNDALWHCWSASGCHCRTNTRWGPVRLPIAWHTPLVDEWRPVHERIDAAPVREEVATDSQIW